MTVTDEEREMLRELHTAFLSIPTGSPPGTLPFIQEVRIVVRAYGRLSWFGRLVAWFMAMVAATAATGKALQVIRSWFVP